MIGNQLFNIIIIKVTVSEYGSRKKLVWFPAVRNKNASCQTVRITTVE